MRLCQRFAASAIVGTLAWAQLSAAQDAQLTGQISTSEGASATSEDPDSAGPPWGPAANSVEIGLFWGVFIPSSKHELYDAKRDDIMYQKLERATPELGLRVGYFPLRFLGIEAEAALLPSETRTTNDAVNLWAVRGHLILQAPTRGVVPFLAIGGGVLGISSSRRILGNDSDLEGHAGVGLKGYVTPDLALRLDVRDNLSQGYGPKKSAQHFEVLLGLAVVLGRPAPLPPPPPDSDGDGIIDPQDRCPQLAGVPPDGCPPPPPDSDGDGIIDANDACPSVAGVASTDPAQNGCPPPPPPDGDGDGVPDASDRCPTVPGDGPDGCPTDSDGDGIPNNVDKCPDQPETVNSFEDTDGCPDELPQIVKKFTGAIAGISFETNKATIKPTSFKVLDEASKVLVDYASLRVEISGHTDISGTLEHNLTLSKDRADAVKAYIVGRGVAQDRIETRGAGPTEPVADNTTADGRSKNRRVEFKLLMEQSTAQPSAAPTPPALVPEPR
jgi:OOP family OmpA-OmpF porin